MQRGNAKSQRHTGEDIEHVHHALLHSLASNVRFTSAPIVQAMMMQTNAPSSTQVTGVMRSTPETRRMWQSGYLLQPVCVRA
jgi:hypothetical protein